MASREKGKGLGGGGRGWADLPEDLLFVIAELLRGLSRVDLMRFCATCSSWRSAARILRGPCGWFRVPASEDERIQKRYENSTGLPAPFNDLFSMYTIYLVQQQKNENQADDDSSSNKCWLARVRDRNYIQGKDKLRFESLSKHVLGYNDNTVPKELNILDVSMYELRKYYTWQCLRGHIVEWSRFDETERIRKVAFIFSRYGAGEFAALAICGKKRKLAFMKSSEDRGWNLIEKYRTLLYSDVIDFNGMFYAVHRTGKVVRIDLSSKVTVVKSPIHKATGGFQKNFVVSAGDLLLLDKHFEGTATNRRGYREPAKSFFKVYKVSVERGKPKLVEIHSLGDRAVFLTRKYCYSVPAQHLPGCIPNCIYFTDHREYYHIHDGTNSRAVFNLEDRSYRLI